MMVIVMVEVLRCRCRISCSLTEVNVVDMVVVVVGTVADTVVLMTMASDDLRLAVGCRRPLAGCFLLSVACCQLLCVVDFAV